MCMYMYIHISWWLAQIGLCHIRSTVMVTPLIWSTVPTQCSAWPQGDWFIYVSRFHCTILLLCPQATPHYKYVYLYIVHFCAVLAIHVYRVFFASTGSVPLLSFSHRDVVTLLHVHLICVLMFRFIFRCIARANYIMSNWKPLKQSWTICCRITCYAISSCYTMECGTER